MGGRLLPGLLGSFQIRKHRSGVCLYIFSIQSGGITGRARCPLLGLISFGFLVLADDIMKFKDPIFILRTERKLD